MATELTLYEEVLLLALDDARGTPKFGSIHGYALGGAIMAELLLSGAVALEQQRKTKLLAATGAGTASDPLLQECLQRVRTAKRRAAVTTWVARFAGTKGLHQRVAERLRQKGVLRLAEGKVLWVFSRDTYPTVNAEPERLLVERIRTAVTIDAPVDPRTSLMIALAHPAGLLASIFDRKQLRQYRKRIKSIAALETGGAGAATTEAIEAAQAAMIATTMAMTVVTTST